MTAAQRATLEGAIGHHAAIVNQMREAGATVLATKHQALVDALRAALGTCGSCEHAGETDGTRVWCAPPIRTDADLDTYPHSYKVMPLGERCNGYTPKEGA